MARCKNCNEVIIFKNIDGDIVPFDYRGHKKHVCFESTLNQKGLNTKLSMKTSILLLNILNGFSSSLEDELQKELDCTEAEIFQYEFQLNALMNELLHNIKDK